MERFKPVFSLLWNKDTATIPGVDYAILLKIEGKGRFLDVNFGVIANPLYQKSWWVEGEVKMYEYFKKVKLPTIINLRIYSTERPKL